MVKLFVKKASGTIISKMFSKEEAEFAKEKGWYEESASKPKSSKPKSKKSKSKKAKGAKK